MATCSTCNRRGHFGTVCMLEFNAWRDKKKLRGEGARINKVAGQEEYSDSKNDDDDGYGLLPAIPPQKKKNYGLCRWDLCRKIMIRTLSISMLRPIVSLISADLVDRPFDGTAKFLSRDTGQNSSLSRDPGTGRDRINPSFISLSSFHPFEVIPYCSGMKKALYITANVQLQSYNCLSYAILKLWIWPAMEWLRYEKMRQ